MARWFLNLGLCGGVGLALGCSSSGANPGREPDTAGTSGGGSAGTTAAGSSGLGGSSGAGGSSAGSPGAGAGSGGTAAGAGGTTAGAGGSGGSSGGSASKAIVTDDFEATAPSGPPDPAKWTVNMMGGTGTVTIDGSMGRNSLRSLRVNGSNQFHTTAMLRGAPLFPAPGNKIAGRVYIRLATPMPQGHVTWLEAGSAMNDQGEIRIGANIGQLDINKYPNDEEQRAPGKVLNPGTWHCLEFVFDGTAHDARVWLDDMELTDLHVTNWVAPMQQNGNTTTPIPNWSPTYEAIRLGWELNGGEVWFDDVAFGYDRIGCL